MYKFISDPGHGWLEVTRAELETLDLLDKISRYSYQRGGFVYLEEDCDAHLLAEAKKARGEPLEVRDEYQANTFIRNLPPFERGAL
jgi:hypothetical protein